MFRNLIKEEKAKGTTIFLTTHNMYDADLLCDRVAFIVGGEITTIDTPHHLKLMDSSKKINIEYMNKGERKNEEVPFEVIQQAIPLKYDSLLSIHSIEPTLEDVFVQMTGKGLV